MTVSTAHRLLALAVALVLLLAGSAQAARGDVTTRDAQRAARTAAARVLPAFLPAPSQHTLRSPTCRRRHGRRLTCEVAADGEQRTTLGTRERFTCFLEVDVRRTTLRSVPASRPSRLPYRVLDRGRRLLTTVTGAGCVA